MPKPVPRIARDALRGYKMDPFTVSGLDIAGVAAWTRPADLKAKDWPAKSDRWSVTLAFPHHTAPAPALETAGVDPDALRDALDEAGEL